MRVITKIAVASLLLLPSLLQAAQGVAQALAGAGYPTSYAPKDLPDDYKAAEIAIAGADIFSVYASVSFLGPSSDPNALNLYEAMKMTWTKGETVVVEGQKFLVTYKLDVDPIKLASRRDFNAPGVQDAQMTLHLLRTDMITSIEPEPTFTKDKLLQAVGGKIPPPPSAISARKAATLSNLKQVSLGLIMYTTDYDDVMPYAQSTRAVAYVTEPYIKNRAIWQTLNPNGGKIQFNMALAGTAQSDYEKPAETPMFYETREWPDGTRIVAYTDGHVKTVTHEAWFEVEKALAWKFKRKAKPLPANYGSSFKFPDESPPSSGSG